MTARWTDIYQAHFQRYFHKPFEVQSYHSGSFGLKLATYDTALPHFHVLASLGLAERLFQNEEEEFGEVILCSDVPEKVVPALFVNALFFTMQNSIPLNSRFAIGFNDRAFTQRYDKSALYFRRPGIEEENEKFDKVRNGEHFGRVYQAYFISAVEDKYLDEYGPDAFDQEFAKQRGEVRSIRRPSCVK